MKRGGTKVECWVVFAALAALSCGAGAAPVFAGTLAPAAAVEAWVRLKGDTTGRVTYEWVRGSAHALPDDARSLPLFRFESVTVRRFLPLGPGRWREVNYACRLYRDHATGAVIDRMTNPLTGGEVPLPSRCSAGPSIIYGPDRVALERDIGFRSSALDGPIALERVDLGTRLVLRREAHSEYRSSASGQTRRETSIDVFTVDARAFANRRIASLRADYHWHSVTQWMTDLDMGDTPGRMAWSVDGRKFDRAEDLPADFRAALLAAVPDALSRPLE